jgi:hypothetical protein
MLKTAFSDGMGRTQPLEWFSQLKYGENLVEDNPETITDGHMCHSKKSVLVMLQEVAKMLDLSQKLGSRLL